MSNQYIHISEAVKKYDKTRQTFYNYLHKGLIRSKKINNRTYLHIADIEELLSEYIGSQTSEVSEEVVEEIYDDLTTQKATIESINEEVHTFKDTIQQNITSQYITINSALQNNQSTLNSLQYAIDSIFSRLQANKQKSRFLIICLLLLTLHLV